MLNRCCRGSLLICSYATLCVILQGNRVAEAFGREDLRPHTVPSDPTRRTALERISFLTLANIGVLLAPPTNPSHATAADEFDNNNNNKNSGDLSLALPMGPEGESKPSAPIEYLLPAARVGVYIYQLFAFAQELAKLQVQQTSSDGNGNADAKHDLIAKLDALLVSPPSFVKTSDPSVSRGSQYGNSLPIVGEIGVAAQKQQERRDRAIDVGFLPQFFEVGELVGERRQWNQLQTAEKQREGASEIRRAFNIYTTNLNFNSNKYQWVGSTQEKSQRIRNDKLPTATDVIRSDLDARDLYRNQVQTSLEDARAEFLYQRRESRDNVQNFDPTELLDLLGQAQTSVDKWFGFIPDQDVQLALEAVQREQR